MTILHTADWHLGKILSHISLIKDQRHCIEQILGIIDAEKPDLMIIAGDIYDRSVPPAEAVELFDYAMHEIIVRRGIPVCAIAGNHDSPERLHCYSTLLAQHGLMIVGLLAQRTADGGYTLPVIPCFRLNHADGPVEVYCFPFVDPQSMAFYTNDNSIKTFHHVFAWMQKHIAETSSAQSADDKTSFVRRVLIAHGTVLGGDISESERLLSVGGVEQVPLDVFNQFHYVALGHLHKPQSFRHDTVRYAGSPIKYSLSEKDYTKSVSMVTLSATGACSVRSIPIIPLRDVRELSAHIERGTLYDEAGARLPYTDDFVRVNLLNTEPILDAAQIIRTVCPNMIDIQWINRQTPTTHISTLNHTTLRTQTPEYLLETFLGDLHGGSISHIQREYIHDIVRHAQTQQT